MAGDAVDGFGGESCRWSSRWWALDDEDLADAGKVEVVVERGAGPNGALRDAAMGQDERLGEVGLSAALEEETDVVAQGRLIAFDGEDIVGVARDEVLGELALGQ
jgi:hypothetical protein